MPDLQLPDDVNIQNQAVPSLLLAGASLNPVGDDHGAQLEQTFEQLQLDMQTKESEIMADIEARGADVLARFQAVAEQFAMKEIDQAALIAQLNIIDDTGQLATQAAAMIDQAAQLEIVEIELSHSRREALISMIDDVVDDVDYLALFRQCSDLALTDDGFASDTRLYDLLLEIDRLRSIRVSISSWPDNENLLSNLEHQAERVAEIRTRLSNEKIVKQPTGDHKSGDKWY